MTLDRLPHKMAENKQGVFIAMYLFKQSTFSFDDWVEFIIKRFNPLTEEHNLPRPVFVKPAEEFLVHNELYVPGCSFSQNQEQAKKHINGTWEGPKKPWSDWGVGRVMYDVQTDNGPGEMRSNHFALENHSIMLTGYSKDLECLLWVWQLIVCHDCPSGELAALACEPKQEAAEDAVEVILTEKPKILVHA